MYIQSGSSSTLKTLFTGTMYDYVLMCLSNSLIRHKFFKFSSDVQALAVWTNDQRFCQDQSCTKDRVRTQKPRARSWFTIERINVFINLSFKKLRSANADVPGNLSNSLKYRLVNGNYASVFDFKTFG